MRAILDKGRKNNYKNMSEQEIDGLGWYEKSTLDIVMEFLKHSFVYLVSMIGLAFLVLLFMKLFFCAVCRIGVEC